MITTVATKRARRYFLALRGKSLRISFLRIWQNLRSSLGAERRTIRRVEAHDVVERKETRTWGKWMRRRRA
jgi:hypothetical protein